MPKIGQPYYINSNLKIVIIFQIYRCWSCSRLRAVQRIPLIRIWGVRGVKNCKIEVYCNKLVTQWTIAWIYWRITIIRGAPWLILRYEKIQMQARNKNWNQWLRRPNARASYRSRATFSITVSWTWLVEGPRFSKMPITIIITMSESTKTCLQMLAWASKRKARLKMVWDRQKSEKKVTSRNRIVQVTRSSLQES